MIIIILNNNLHLGGKYMLKIQKQFSDSVTRGNCDHQGADNVPGKIRSSFFCQINPFVFIFQIFLCSFENRGIFDMHIPQFLLGPALI